MTLQQGGDFAAEVVAAISRGQKIEAIRLLREAQGIGLKEAKDQIDRYIDSRPELKMSLAAAQEQAKKRLLTWVVLFAAALFAVYWMLSRW